MKDGFIKVACAKCDIKTANVTYNTNSITENIYETAKSGAKLIVFPELCVTGSTCGDLFLQDTLLEGAENALLYIADKTKDIDSFILVGAPIRKGIKIYNCAVALYAGEIVAIIPKTNIANNRVFTSAGKETETVNICGKEYPFGRDIILVNKNMPSMSIGVEFGDDIYTPLERATMLCSGGANIIACLAADYEAAGKNDTRHALISANSLRTKCVYLYSNAPYGESTTDYIFSGCNMIYENGVCLSQSKPFEFKTSIADIDTSFIMYERRKQPALFAQQELCKVIFNMPVAETTLTRTFEKLPFVSSDECKEANQLSDILVMQGYALKKRLEHTYSKSVVIGISGGLDSTLALLTCATAADLMGKSRSYVHAVSMPCFGTTNRTKSNSQKLCELLGVDFEEINISNSVTSHLKEIGHDINDHSVVFENAQARMRTLVLMDISNKLNGLVLGTGDLSELALGWATYNGDHMAMYGVNGSVPKTLMRHIVKHYADTCNDERLKDVLYDILATPVSPELLPATSSGEIAQKTEDLVGPYQLHDFYIYYTLQNGFTPTKLYRAAKATFKDEYSDEVILMWLKNFYKRFFSQQFKRSCMPDGAKVTTLSLSPRGDLSMPSDADYEVWRAELETLG